MTSKNSQDNAGRISQVKGQHVLLVFEGSNQVAMSRTTKRKISRFPKPWQGMISIMSRDGVNQPSGERIPHAPSDELAIVDLGTTEFDGYPLPNSEVMQNIEKYVGAYDFSHVSDELVRDMGQNANRGAGGKAPAGQTAIVWNRDKFATDLRIQIRRIIENRGDGVVRDFNILIIFVASTFGGWARGTMQESIEIAHQVKQEFNCEIYMWRFILVPATQENEDLNNSRALTAGAFMELAAFSSGWLQDRPDGKSLDEPGARAAHSIPTFVFSCCNNDTRRPLMLSGVQLNSALADLLTLLPTEFGCHQLERSRDTEDDEGRIDDVYKNRCHLNSMGISMVESGIEGFRAFVHAAIKTNFLHQISHNDFTEEQVTQAAMALCAQYGLIETKDRDNLSSRLKTLFHIRSMAGQMGREASDRGLKEAQAKAGELLQHHRREAAECNIPIDTVVDNFRIGLNEANRRTLRNRRQGNNFALEMLRTVSAGLENQITETSGKLADWELKLQNAEANSARFLPALQVMGNWGFLKRKVKNDRVIGDWNLFLSSLVEEDQVRKDCKAIDASIVVLKKCQELVHDATNKIGALKEAISEEIDLLVGNEEEDTQGKLFMLQSHSIDFECPNGVCLLHPKDYSTHLARQFGVPEGSTIEESTQGAVDNIMRRLQGRDIVEEFQNDSKAFFASIEDAIREQYDSRLKSRDIVRDFAAMFPPGESKSETIYMDLDQRSREFIELNEAVLKKNPSIIQRYILFKGATREHPIVKQFNINYDSTNEAFHPIDIPDAERIYLISVRRAFPPQAITRLLNGEWFKAYDEVSLKKKCETLHIHPIHRLLLRPDKVIGEDATLFSIGCAWTSGMLEADNSGSLHISNPRTGKKIKLGDGMAQWKSNFDRDMQNLARNSFGVYFCCNGPSKTASRIDEINGLLGDVSIAEENPIWRTLAEYSFEKQIQLLRQALEGLLKNTRADTHPWGKENELRLVG